MLVDLKALAPVPGIDPQVENALSSLWRNLPYEWITTPPPRIDYLLTRIADDGNRRGVVPQGIVVALVAAGGVGKTFVAIDLAICSAAGVPWLGFDTSAAWSVILLGETSETELHRRIYWICRLLNLTDEQRRKVAERVIALPLAGQDMTLVGDPRDDGALPRTPFCMDLDERLDRLQAEMGNLPGILIIDGHARAASAGAETDNYEATKAIQVYESLQRPNRTVVVLHHTNKTARREGIMGGNDTAAAAAARGASGFTDGARLTIVLDALKRVDGSPELLTLRIAKKNDVASAPDVVLVRDEQHQGAIRPADPWEIAAYQEAVDGAKEAQKESRAWRAHEHLVGLVVDLLRKADRPIPTDLVRERLAKNKPAIAAALAEAESRGLAERVFEGRRPRGWRAVEATRTDPDRPGPGPHGLTDRPPSLEGRSGPSLLGPAGGPGPANADEACL